MNNGYAIIYPNEFSLLLKMTKWISYENRCFLFINFSLFVSGDVDSIRLELTGNETVKNLLRKEFRFA
ncbi:hypothetical protein [Pseudoneobacillus rhizosphaerae]|uniref:hypothetical protein n=1 Tax=Pseudoneobacillus rhizosphaerae TaxID=2880968 RepID=UPI001E51B1A6|nr:hypothetical protein [Pseudoneobacillus rhizosphaerae]